jgi:probable F420-dependent oxidoreductase
MKFCTGLPLAMCVRDAREGHPECIGEIARGVEELGFFGVTVPHHVLHHGVGITGHEAAETPQWRYPDPIAMLGYLAAVTRTLRLIPRVLVVPYRKPVELAHSLASVDSLSGGRLVFCPAVGGEPGEFARMGISRGQRGRITEESLDLVYRLWAGESVTLEGASESATLLVRPVQQPRPVVWVGGSSRAALRRAVRIGDGWTPTCFPYPMFGGDRSCVSIPEFAEDVAWSSQERATLGMPPLEYVASSAPPLEILDRPRARSASKKPITYFSGKGNPDELRDEFQAFVDAGATSFVVNFWGDTPEAFLEAAQIFAKEVMPAFAQ